MTKLCTAILLSAFLVSASGEAMEAKPVNSAAGDKCPVCGMFVARYPDWVAEIIYRDGSVQFFDGTKDLFKFYLEPHKFKATKKRQNIEAIYVTEYYDLSFIEATKAFYVIGSDVYGPMGHEIIPFKTEKDAREFIRDHQGQRIISFEDVDPALLNAVDQ